MKTNKPRASPKSLLRDCFRLEKFWGICSEKKIREKSSDGAVPEVDMLSNDCSFGFYNYLHNVWVRNLQTEASHSIVTLVI